jgi:hypothetical protein
VLVASAGFAVAASNDQPTAAAPIAAKWVPRTVHFMYTPVNPSSVTTYYSCDRLQGQITAMLRQLGARDSTVKPFGCITVGGPERFAGVDATFSVLEPTGSGDPAAGSTGATSSADVQAQWGKVTLARGTSCELIEQVKRSILPLFTARNPSSGCSPRFSVEVLRPVKSAAADS